MLFSESTATALIDARCELTIGTMLLGLFQSDSLALLHHWLLAVGVLPSQFPTKIQQDVPEVFLVCARFGLFHVLLIFCMFSQGAFPPL